MDLTATTIIYLALGAPFAVYQFTSGFPRSRGEKWLIFASILIGWPIVAARIVIDRFRAPAGDRDPRVEALRTTMEKIAFPDNDIQPVFEFREVLYRFVGLRKALTTIPSNDTLRTMLGVDSSGKEMIAARCHARRNRSRIENHYHAARGEFIETIDDAAAGIANGGELIDLAVELSCHIGDPMVPEDFRLARRVTPASRRYSGEGRASAGAR